MPDISGSVAIFRLAGTIAGQALERAVPVALLLRGRRRRVGRHHPDMALSRGRPARPPGPVS